MAPAGSGEGPDREPSTRHWQLLDRFEEAWQRGDHPDLEDFLPADPAEWLEKFEGRTRSIDGLPTRPTDRYIAGDG